MITKHYTIKPLYTNRNNLKMLSINFYYFGVMFYNKFPFIEVYKNYFEVA